MKLRFLLAVGAIACPAMGMAQTAVDPLAPLTGEAKPATPAVPQIVINPATSGIDQGIAPVPVTVVPPQPEIQVPRSWREVFAAIRSENWAAAHAGINALGPSVLSPVAKAQLYTARNSPAAQVSALTALLAEAPELPDADQLARMAANRGATAVPAIPYRAPMIFLGSAPRRSRANPVPGEPQADLLRSALDPLIKSNSAPEAEALLLERLPLLSYEARAEAGQRVAWSYYVLGRDADARRVADAARAGAIGEWAGQAAWVSALASWRLRDYGLAAQTFREAASRTPGRELRAACLYWSARSEMANRNPAAVTPLLRAAGESPESFYGLVARKTLGMPVTLPSTNRTLDTSRVEGLPNVRRAIELTQIGESWLADEYLRHQARIGPASDHGALIEVAKRLDLASAQFWLAHNGPRGAQVRPTDRYPAPRWAPHNGWRIDPALAYAHTLQESSFRPAIVSPAGAVGLMQVLPTTANLMARRNGLPYSQASLTSPALNMEYGQSFLEFLRDNAATRGQLPKIIAAYNAGPLPVERWNYIYDKGDPLLWIESIPYWETRYYVPAVMRNLWVYQAQSNDPPTLRAMAEHRWPTFPARRPSQVVSLTK